MSRNSFMNKLMNLVSQQSNKPMKSWDCRYIRAGRSSRSSSNTDNKILIKKIRKLLMFLSGSKIVSMLKGFKVFYYFQRSLHFLVI